MIPYIDFYFWKISTFAIMIICGIASMFLLIHKKLMKEKWGVYEENYIFPKLVFCGMIGYLSAAVVDALFKWRENGGIQFSGITFYGGLLGVVISLIFSIIITQKNTNYTVRDWFSILTPPFIVFHIWGRIGCFLGGCCYGKPTNSIIGLYFPDNPEHGIYHYGMKCYPTQLFEVAFLMVILMVTVKVKKKFEVYLLLYAVARFVIEFFRGDDRGYILKGISPAQMISLIIIIAEIGIGMKRKFFEYKKNERKKMEIFDNIGKKITMTSHTMVQRAKGIADITGLKAQIIDEQKKRDSYYTNLGREYYDLKCKEVIPELQELIEMIAKSNIRIEELNKSISSIENIKTCPVCGKPLNDGMSFCIGCGTKIAQLEGSNSGTEKTETKPCINCGFEIPIDAAFCTKCGIKQM